MERANFGRHRAAAKVVIVTKWNWNSIILSNFFRNYFGDLTIWLLMQNIGWRNCWVRNSAKFFMAKMYKTIERDETKSTFSTKCWHIKRHAGEILRNSFIPILILCQMQSIRMQFTIPEVLYLIFKLVVNFPLHVP